MKGEYVDGPFVLFLVVIGIIITGTVWEFVKDPRGFIEVVKAIFQRDECCDDPEED